jgi:hypothetical protein
VVLNPNELHNNIYLPSGEEKKISKHKHKNGCTSGAGTANPSGAPEFTAMPFALLDDKDLECLVFQLSGFERT